MVYNRDTGKSGVVVAARLMQGDLEDSYVLRSDGKAKGVKPQHDYEPGVYVRCVGFEKGMPLVKTVTKDDEPIGRIVSQAQGNIPMSAASWGEYDPQLADVEFFGNKIITIPLVDDITENIECHDSVTLANDKEFTKAEEKNNTRVLEPRKSDEDNIKKIAILSGFTGVM